MKNLEVTTHPEVKQIFNKYPDFVQNKMEHLRKLILETASEIEEIDAIEETLKWGEPSYIAKTGSTLRMDWKEKSPRQYALYFKCTSKLVPTFKTVFKNTFNYEKTRAIVFDLEDKIPEQELKHCIAATLMYHKVKQLPLLGIPV